MLSLSMHADEHVTSFLFEAQNEISQDEIHRAFSQPMFVETLTFNFNAFMDLGEVSYLLGFKEGDHITGEQFKQAIDHLLLKNRFERIEVTISPGVLGKHMHIDAHSFWALDTLRIHGWLRGKEKYRALYLIALGEKFDESKHAHSIKKIKDALRSEGFLNASVLSEFSYDYQRRTMRVDLTVKKGKLFSIGKITLNAPSLDLQQKLYKTFLKSLKRRTYSKITLQDQIRAMKAYLSDVGYISVDLHVEEKVDNDNRLVDLEVTIECAGKRTIVFFGNHFFSSHELREMLLEFGKSAWLVPAEILSDELKHAYFKKGFWHASIEAHDEPDRYLFVIQEGLRVKIKDVILRGNTRFDEELLKKKFFNSVLTAEWYEEKLISQALVEVKTFYQNLGYLDVAIIDQDYQECDEKGVYNLILTIDEGAQWFLNGVHIPEYPDLAANEIFNQRNIPFNAELLESQRSWLINYFTTQGYSSVRVSPTIHQDIENKVSIEWQVTKGPRAKFGKTVVVGTSTLPYNLICKELQYKEGDAWNSEAVKKTFASLKELEIFDIIQLHPAAHSASEVEKTMVLKLHQDDPYEVRLRAGIELQYIQEYRTFGGLTYKLGGSFLAKNPFNRADLFRLDTDFARSHFEVVAKYRQPSFFSIPLRTTMQTYAIKHDQPGFVGNTNNLYRLTQYGGLINLGKKTEHLDAGMNIGFEWMETKLNEPTRLFAIELAHALNFDIRLLDKNVPYFLMEPTILLDFVDNNLYPHKGSLTLFSAKGMFPLKHSELEAYFVKVLFEQSFYFPIEPVVIALRLRFGHIFHQDFSAIMPSERFYLGGSQSIRSYNADLCPPLGVFYDNKGKEMIVPRGGKTMINGNAEVRIPLHVSLEGVLFQDLGMLSSDNFATFTTKDVLSGTGFGIRIKTPIGPLRFDFGFKWRKDVPTQPAWAWTFMFGNAF